LAAVFAEKDIKSDWKIFVLVRNLNAKPSVREAEAWKKK